MRLLTTFNGDATETRWTALSDTVMGGRSSCEPLIEAGALVFRGELSLENKGGFASIRSLGKTSTSATRTTSC